MVLPRRPTSKDFLQQGRSLHHFIQKVAEYDVQFRLLMDGSKEIHVQWTRDALTKMISERSRGRPLREVSLDAGSPELKQKRHVLLQEIQKHKTNLLLCKQELPIYRKELSEEHAAQLDQYMTLEIDRTDQEIELFQVPSLSTLDSQMLEVLVRVEELSSSEDSLKPLEVTKTEELEQTLIHWAAQQGKRDILDYLLSIRGAHEMMNAPDNHGRTPLYYAEKLSHALVERGAADRVHSQDYSGRPDMRSLGPDKLKIIDAIETNGWEQIQFIGGYTILHWAAYKGNGSLCKYLMHLQGNPLAEASDRCTPIMLAKLCEQQDVLRELESQPERRRSKLEITHHHFQRKGIPIPNAYRRVVEQIEERGWSEMEWARNYTLLHWAAKNNRADLCSHFMYRRADPNARDDQSKSAFDYAQDNKCAAALRVMQQDIRTPLSALELSQLVYHERMRGSVVISRDGWMPPQESY